MPSTSPPGPRPAKGKGLGGSRRARTSFGTAEGADGNDSDDPPVGRRPRRTARDRALVLLGVRWRSREELRRRLTAAGFEADEVERALADLERAGLIDDGRFAREVVAQQAGRRLASDRAIRQRLRESGVGPQDVEAVLGSAADEAERAFALAERQALRLSSIDAATTYRRTLGLLLRRGYDHATAREAVTRALAMRLTDDAGGSR
jgi:regulatory protein